MSCGCTSTPSPSITCGSCGYQCTSCVCPPDPIVMPTVTCADPPKCTEIYPLECVQYTGPDIKCSTLAGTLYPNVTHIVATNGDMLPNILNNINSQLCYLFSSDFISTFLNTISTDSELQDIFCSLLDSCGTSPTQLICPTVSSVTYVIDTTQNYLQAQFNYVPYATSYTYQFYTETTYGSGTYDDPIGSATTIPQPSIALPISVTTLLSSTYTASKNYAVLVYVQGSLNPNGIDPALNSSFTYNSLDVNNAHCGINRYLGTAETQTCALEPVIHGALKYMQDPSIFTWQFHFQQQSQVPSIYIPITSYNIHWYIEKTTPFLHYAYLGSINIPFNALNIENISLYKPVTVSFTYTGNTVTVTSPGHGLITGQQIYIPYTVINNLIPIGYYTITVTNADTFTFTIISSTSGGGFLTYCCSKLSPNDRLVAMIQILTADPTCYLGVQPRVNSYFLPSEIATYTSNTQYDVYKNFGI